MNEVGMFTPLMKRSDNSQLAGTGSFFTADGQPRACALPLMIIASSAELL